MNITLHLRIAGRVQGVGYRYALGAEAQAGGINGWVRNRRDGTVEDSHHTTIGYIKSDGTIEDSHRTTIGYIKSDGTVEDSHRSTLGRSKGSREQTAMEYFFFKIK